MNPAPANKIGERLAQSLTHLSTPTRAYQPTIQRLSITYDHTCQKTRDPVRSPLVKLARAKLVLRSVTTGESLVLYVFLLPYFPVEHRNPPL